ncbi:MAG: type II toxin-antitoxin system death-on-curing family toxin [Thermodesulfovibrionales bacterium]|nr:type II toxin-antitoxin system death-on-curing family toxin [Thermodesulfovibrionales bacterium]
MTELLFLGLDEVVEIHRDQIERYGGSPGIRNIELLQSAVAMPAAGFGEDYLHTDIYEMAAAYLFHIVRNHPFIDGNKRTGAVASVVFLLMNGTGLHASENSFEKIVRSVAEGKTDKAGAAEFFRRNSRVG